MNLIKRKIKSQVKGRTLYLVIFPCILLLLQSSHSFAQEYGLGFSGQPNSKDKRTQLDLNPGGYFSFKNEFELSFQLRIRDEWPMTFGYIFRIVDLKNDNVDLLFNGPKSNSLQVVNINKLTAISIPFHDSTIFREWYEIRLKFNLREKTIEFITPDTSLTVSDISLAGKFKILFGRNTVASVQTTDVPTMDIKDIKILKSDRILHHFPLNELSGNTIKDLQSRMTALVQNPMWIRPKYYNWNEHFSTILNGFAPMCYAPHKEELYLVGDEQIKIFSIKKDSIQTIEYASVFTGLNPGSQVIFDTINEKLICYNLRDRTVFNFNFLELRWEKLFDGQDNLNRLWFHNKYYSGSDSLLYIFGGYSQHRYSNLVLQYDFKRHLWDTIPATGDVFHPRMHAALGVLEDTVYILGGFGSTAGDQVVNPSHYTDLLAFSLKEKKFIKKYDFTAPSDDVDFSHSMVIDPDERFFYVLASSIYQYESNLQLLKGSLSDPELCPMGNSLPYLFHNENSYSDLYFSRSLQKLIAVTSLADRAKDETVFKVYTISFPPFPAETRNFNMNKLLGMKVWTILIWLIVVTLLILGVRRFMFRKANKITPHGSVHRHSGTDLHESEKSLTNGTRGRKSANTILFFGGFQVIDHSGEDITRKFSPLVKELFLLIFLYSVKDKGISVPRITELLWFPMDAKSAKNNRAVNIAKLKHLLAEIDSCVLTRKTEYWRILFDNSKVYSDYYVYHQLTNDSDTISRNDLDKLLGIIKTGPLLGNVSYEWLDEFKLDCSNRISDVLINYLEKETSSVEPDLMVRIADAILIFDIMHEEAISIKCRALTELGKHSLAKEIFNKFSRDYQSLYDEPYDKSFTDLIKNN